MSTSNIKDWAAYAEIVASAAVVISLLFVVQSINQNTKAIEAAEMNNINTGWRDVVQVSILSDPELAETIAKARAGDALTPGEQIRWDTLVSAKMDIWAQLFDLHQNGVISTEAWQGYEGGFWVHWKADEIASTWTSRREIYSEAFRQYIDAESRQRANKD